MGILLEYMQQRSGVSFGPKYYVTAERNEAAVWHRQALYDQISSLGFTIDIRTFKGKQAVCPNKQCKMNKTGFNM